MKREKVNTLKEFIKLHVLNESEVYMEDPSDFDNSSIGRLSNSQSVDFTNLSVEESIKRICLLVENHKELNISFVDQYDARAPRLSVNPSITWDTPHGIYGYPLNSFNLNDFLRTGSPTKATFATDRNYFHIYKIADLNSIKIKKDYRTSYKDINYYKDIATLTKLACRFILSKIERSGAYRLICQRQVPKNISSIVELRKEFKKSLDDNSSQAFKKIVAYLYLLHESENKDIPDFVIEDISSYLTKLSYSKENKFSDRAQKSKFYSIYFSAYFLSRLIENSSIQIVEKDPPKAGGIFTVLLNGIGIDSIQDIKGTSLLHQNEPNQTVSFDINRISGENLSYHLLGTFKNFYKKGNYNKIADTVIEDLLTSSQISIDTIYPEKTLSLKTFEEDVKEELDNNKMFATQVTSHLGESITKAFDEMLQKLDADVMLEDKDINLFKGKINNVYKNALSIINQFSARLHRLALKHKLNPESKNYKNITDVYYDEYKSVILENFANSLFYSIDFFKKLIKYSNKNKIVENNYLKALLSIEEEYSIYKSYRTE